MCISLISSDKLDAIFLHSKQRIKKDSFINSPCNIAGCKYGPINAIYNVCNTSVGSDFANLRMTPHFY